MRYDVSVIGLYILDVLGRPVVSIPERGNVEFIDEIRLTVAGTAGGTVIDTAKLGLEKSGSGGASATTKRPTSSSPPCRNSASTFRRCSA